MTDKIEICVDIEPTDASVPLGFEIWVDETKFYDNSWVQAPETISFQIDDDEAIHVLKYILKNKLMDHTSVNADGDIIKDALIVTKNLKFDGIDLGFAVNVLSKYSHNFNGNGTDIVESFTGTMGCNGTVSLEFSTPVYLWMLENL